MPIECICKAFLEQRNLKADRPHLQDYLHKPSAHRHTDKYIRIRMAMIALFFTFDGKMKVIDQTVQAREHCKRTDRQANGCYQVYYLPASQSIKVSVVSCLCGCLYLP